MAFRSVYKDEIDILYAISNKLAGASTPDEVLDAVLAYAREHGATAARLLYTHGEREDAPRVGRIMAEWVAEGAVARGVGGEYREYGEVGLPKGWLETPDQPLLLNDAPGYRHFHPLMRQRLAEDHEWSMALLPLNNRGRWVGTLIFSWSEPYTFTARDRRIYTALIRQTAPVIDSLRLLEENRRRAARAEHLVRINTALSQAVDEMQIVDAVALYARLHGADRIILNYIDPDPDETPIPIRSDAIAIWQGDAAEMFDERRHMFYPIGKYGYVSLWYDSPDQALLIENIETEGRIAPDVRIAITDSMPVRALATLPLFNGGRCRGVMTVSWFKPHTFNDEERYIYNSLLRTLPSIVASRRAYLAEQAARREQELLYRISEAVNAAHNYEEIADALARLEVGDDAGFSLRIFNDDDDLLPDELTEQEHRLNAAIGEMVSSALERIRLRMETDASRRRAETLAGVNAALSQARDEQSILAAVATLAERYGATLSILSYSQARDSVNIVALRAEDGDSPIPLSLLPLASFPLSQYPILSLIYDYPTEMLFIEDTLDDGRLDSAQSREFLSRVGWGAVVMEPLYTNDALQGVLTFVWREPRTFDQEMRDLFAAVQTTTASVVTSRRAYLAEEAARRETELRAHQLQTIARISAAAASRLDVVELVETVYHLAQENFNQYHIAIYLVGDEPRPVLRCVERKPSGGVLEMCESMPLDADYSVVARAGKTRKSVIVNNMKEAEGFTLLPHITDLRSEIAVPMVAGDRLIGVLDVQSNKSNRFTDTDVYIMAMLADLIAVAVQNARLYTQAQELAALEERTRLARELHDSVSQALYGIGLGARTAKMLLDRDPSRVREPLDYVLSLAEAGLAEMRALIFELRPESLEQEGLITALVKQAASLQARHNIRVVTEFCDEPTFSIEAKETLYRIAREALHNTVKHAQASDIELKLTICDDGYLLSIKDNGVGFDPSGAFPGHLGLKSMRERAERMNGTFEVHSQTDAGTHIRVTIPQPLY
ncbi:MAG: GAF domain-containing protein [Chloroflexota bacterium]|nr:GAF domain-containing protein [Chloroflexota bacterium]